jgi:glycosyltransferase involved in cell wall biosynthesis
MDISVVIPVYNSRDIIGQCLDSMLRQDFKGSFEVILVDDCSTDGSREVIERLAVGAPVPVKVLSTPANGGYPVAMQVGIAASSGRYIARQDADDVSHPSRLRLQFEAIEANPDMALVSCIRYWLTPYGRPFHNPQDVKSGFSLETWEGIMTNQRRFTDAACMFRRDHYEQVGGYSTYQRSGMDYDLWLRLIELTGHPVMTLEKPLYGRRLIPNSLIYQSDTTHNNTLPRQLARLRQQEGLPPDHRPDPEWIRQRRAETPRAKGDKRRVRFIMDTGLTCLGMGDWKGFLDFLGTSFRRNPTSTLRLLAGALLRGHASNKKPGFPVFGIS